MREGWKRLPVREVMAAGMVTISAGANATEIPKDASFATGIMAMHKDTLTKGPEFRLTYLQSGGKTHWFIPDKGEASKVTTSPEEEAAELISSGLLSSKSAKVCIFHEHTLGAALHENMITEKDAQRIAKGEIGGSFPPSSYSISISGDIAKSGFEGLRTELDKAMHDAGISTDVQIEYGTVDPVGIFYYRPFKKADVHGYLSEWADLEIKSDKALFRWSDIQDSFGPLPESIRKIVISELERGGEYEKGELAYWQTQDAGDYDKWLVTRAFKMVEKGDASLAKKMLSDHQYQAYEDFVKVGNVDTLNERLDATRQQWQQLSMSVPRVAAGKALLNSPTYLDLRTIAALQGIAMRFVPIEDVASEPPCAGVDFKKSE